METEKKWADLTPVEKREKRYEWWLSADINFSGPEARKSYKERALRFVNACRSPVRSHPGIRNKLHIASYQQLSEGMTRGATAAGSEA